MTDDFRTRIAAALVDALFAKGAYTEYGTDGEPGEWERVDGHINLTALADVVIHELGLRKECRQAVVPHVGIVKVDPGSFTTANDHRQEHRYVTDWIAP